MDNIRGASLMVGSMAAFAIEDMFIKQMTGALPTGQIILLIGLGGATVFGLWSFLRGEAVFPKTLLRGAALWRSILEAITSTFFVMALAIVPFTVFTTIMQANPIVVTLGAALFFAEPVGWRRWTAITVGLVGVLIVIRPFGATFDSAALLVVAGVVTQAGRDLATRRTVSTITTLQLSTAGFAALVPAGAGLMIALGTPLARPDQLDTLRLLGAIGIGIPALYMVILANRIGDLSFVAPFRYSRIVFGLLVGLIMFGEQLDAITLFGAAIIVASGLYSLAREARRRRTSLSAKVTL